MRVAGFGVEYFALPNGEARRVAKQNYDAQFSDQSLPHLRFPPIAEQVPPTGPRVNPGQRRVHRLRNCGQRDLDVQCAPLYHGGKVCSVSRAAPEGPICLADQNTNRLVACFVPNLPAVALLSKRHHARVHFRSRGTFLYGL